MNLNWSPEENAFRTEVRDFLQTCLPEHLKAGMRATPTVFVEPDIGREWQRILNEKGWLAYNWPEEYGGCNWSPSQKYLFEKECALAGVPALPVLGLKLLGPVICAYGTDEQKDRILPRILSGEDYWCQGFSEPGAGSDLANLRTKAELKDSTYIVNGSKTWTTHGHHATHMFCLVRTNADAKPQHGISFLLIDMKQPGVEVRPIIGLAGDHEVNQIFLDNAEVPLTNIVGAEGQGWAIAKFLLENERGGACHAPQILSDVKKVRQNAHSTFDGFGTPLTEQDSFASDLDKIELEAIALEMTELRILADLSKGHPPGPNTSIVKLVSSNLRQKIDTLALRAAGYAGLHLEASRPLYGNEAPEPLTDQMAQLAAPNYLNSRAWTIFGGTNEVQRTIIAKAVLGL